MTPAETRARNELIARQYRDSHQTMAEIGKAHGISKQRVHQLLITSGVIEKPQRKQRNILLLGRETELLLSYLRDNRDLNDEEACAVLAEAVRIMVPNLVRLDLFIETVRSAIERRTSWPTHFWHARPRKDPPRRDGGDRPMTRSSAARDT